jgi:hypothetical protein
MGDPHMRVPRSRAAFGSLAVALLTLAMMAPTALAAPGNGGGHGQGHGKPADAGPSRGQGHGSKPDKQAKHDKHAKPDKGSKSDTSTGDTSDEDSQDTSNEPTGGSAAGSQRHGGANFLAMLPCKAGGWQTLQGADGTLFDNQGLCVSYAVHGGVLMPIVSGGDPILPADDPAGEAFQHGRANYLATLACKSGGWQDQQREDGTRFDNQGHCVSYAVHGGVLVPIVPLVTISFVPYVDPNEPSVPSDQCDATATLADFDPSTTYVGDLTVDGLPGTVDPITTDALGDASVALGTFAAGLSLELTVDGVSSGATDVACPPDVEAP